MGSLLRPAQELEGSLAARSPASKLQAAAVHMHPILCYLSLSWYLTVWTVKVDTVLLLNMHVLGTQPFQRTTPDDFFPERFRDMETTICARGNEACSQVILMFLVSG